VELAALDSSILCDILPLLGSAYNAASDMGDAHRCHQYWMHRCRLEALGSAWQPRHGILQIEVKALCNALGSAWQPRHGILLVKLVGVCMPFSDSQWIFTRCEIWILVTMVVQSCLGQSVFWCSWMAWACCWPGAMGMMR
jgi:hypothetical protein